MICAIISRFRSLSYQYTPSRFSIGEFTREMPTQTNAREPVKFFRRVCPALFLSAQFVRFWTVLSDPEHPIRNGRWRAAADYKVFIRANNQQSYR
jgi:hypothetical protein